jgi:hypothetical protein
MGVFTYPSWVTILMFIEATLAYLPSPKGFAPELLIRIGQFS